MKHVPLHLLLRLWHRQGCRRSFVLTESLIITQEGRNNERRRPTSKRSRKRDLRRRVAGKKSGTRKYGGGGAVVEKETKEQGWGSLEWSVCVCMRKPGKPQSDLITRLLIDLVSCDVEITSLNRYTVRPTQPELKIQDRWVKNRN